MPSLQHTTLLARPAEPPCLVGLGCHCVIPGLNSSPSSQDVPPSDHRVVLPGDSLHLVTSLVSTRVAGATVTNEYPPLRSLQGIRGSLPKPGGSLDTRLCSGCLSHQGL